MSRKVVNFVRTHYLSVNKWDFKEIKQKSRQFLKSLSENPEIMKILDKNYIMTEIVRKLYTPKQMGYHPQDLNYINIKNDEGKYIQVECPFIGNISEYFKEYKIEIPLEFYKGVLNTGIYALILPGTTPQQIYEFLIFDPNFGFQNPTSKNLILLIWKQFQHLLEPKIDYIVEFLTEKSEEFETFDVLLNTVSEDECVKNTKDLDYSIFIEIFVDYESGIDNYLLEYMIKDLRNIVFDYMYKDPFDW